MKKTIKPPSGMTPNNLATALAVVQHALRSTIEAIPNIETSDPNWLDKLEEELVRDAKGTAVTGIPIGEEAEAIRFGIELLEATLDACRLTLGRERD